MTTYIMSYQGETATVTVGHAHEAVTVDGAEIGIQSAGPVDRIMRCAAHAAWPEASPWDEGSEAWDALEYSAA